MKHNDIVKCNEGDLVKMIKDTYSSECEITDVRIVESTIDTWVIRVAGIVHSESSCHSLDDIVFVSQFTQSYYRIER